MLRPLILSILLALAGLSAHQAMAQEPPAGSATLLANRIFLSGQGLLVAEGAVEVFYGTVRLSATRITYDSSGDRLSIEGPIRLTESGSIDSVLLADAAELSADLRDGILVSARMVLAQQLQLAANSIERREGRFTSFERVIASSCQICAANPTPLWEIRAARVTHDSQTRQLHFEHAQFRALGVPIAYFPVLRMPDPTVERMSGFLLPEARTTSNLGTGLKLPYFLAIDASRDLTITPYLSTSRTATLELRYRQAFANGALEANSAVSRDTILPGQTRSYLFADAEFALPRGFYLDLDLRMTSDPAYLLDYGISETDRLWSGAKVERITADELITARLGNTHTLRTDEDNATQPALAGDFRWLHVLRPSLIGGEATLDWQVHGHRRASSLDGDAGRDMARASVFMDWRRNWLLFGGIMSGAQLGLGADLYAIGQDSAYPATVANLHPSAAIELRWPWARGIGGATQIIEPVAQVIWSRADLNPVPNDDSMLTEFDEGNLFALSRFAGADAREQGLRANIGASFTHYDVAGWSLGLTAGRVLRREDLGQFSSGSGLSGTKSNWLLATHLDSQSGLSLSNRMLFDDDLSITRDELRLALQKNRLDLALGYIWMQPDLAEGRPFATSEVMLDSGWNWDSGWSGRFKTRYDITAERAATAGLGLTYSNECVTLDLSLSRRFTSSISVRPETKVGLSVALVGFGAKGGGQRRVCAP